MADAVEQEMPHGHGLYYVDRYRHNPTVFVLDRESFPEIGRPERDVLRGLLRYALDRLDELDRA